MIIIPLLKVLRLRWRLVALLALALVLFSLLLLYLALQPGVEPLRWQATLAPTLLVPPGGAP